MATPTVRKGVVPPQDTSPLTGFLSPRMTTLGTIEAQYVPIFCCTDLASGSHFNISTHFVAGVAPSLEGQSINVSGSAPDLAVASAVAASAAFPFVFRPTVIDATVLGLPVRRGIIDSRVVLADGGLYDNFGIDVLEAWLNGDMNSSVLRDLGEVPDTILAVDCGQPSHQRQRRTGLVRRIARSLDIVHQSNSLSRRREIQRQFASGTRHGSLISIGDNPSQLTSECANPHWRQLAESWLDALAHSHQTTHAGWQSIAQQGSPAIATNLRKLGKKKVAQLVLHGYASMMARTTTELGWQPPAATALPADIERLCAEPFVGSFIHRLLWILTGSRNEAAQ